MAVSFVSYATHASHDMSDFFIMYILTSCCPAANYELTLIPWKTLNRLWNS
jgi:hypothetical protein